MMKGKLFQRAIVLFIVIALTAGGWFWRDRQYVRVDISAHQKEAKIFLARSGPANLTWFSILPGQTKLRKSAYYFRLEFVDRNQVGLIAVDDDTPIVLQ